MATVQTSASSSISDGYDFFSIFHWDTNTFVINLQDGYDDGVLSHWDTYSTTTNLEQSLFVGYFENWDLFKTPALNLFENVQYAGYTANWGQTTNTQLSTNLPISMIDTNTVIDHPKDQTIYYKLKGYNTLTSSFESWIVTENITSRPETFEPGQNLPSIDKDVNRVPPTSNNLINVTIVARWIQ